MNDLTYLIWNDVKKTAEDWQQIVAGSIADNKLESVQISADADVAHVIGIFDTYCPDVVILDIMAPDNKQKGLEIAAAIRKRDLLVPIVAVTTEPSVVYKATNKVEEIGFAGIYDASVMQPGIFEEIALRPSLNQWHMVAPEYPLVRTCARLVKTRLGAYKKEFVDELHELLISLPFSGSDESWHEQIREPLARLVGMRGCHALCERFLFMCKLFEESEPFYMAGSRSRRHLSHNVRVFLTGLLLLLAWDEFRAQVISSIRSCGQSGSDDDALADALVIWACIANTHDAAYLSEGCGELSKRLSRLMKEFGGAFEAVDQIEDVQAMNWPRRAHGEVAAKLWRKGLPEKQEVLEDKYRAMIAAAIARHDSKHAKNQRVDSVDWASFLAVLSDELQDWGRDRLTNPPGGEPYITSLWRMFCLDEVRFENRAGKGPDASVMRLAFVVRDYPDIIAGRLGTGGEETVKRSFNQIGGVIIRNLSSSVPLSISLVARFISRPNAKPAIEIIPIPAPKVATTGAVP